MSDYIGDIVTDEKRMHDESITSGTIEDESFFIPPLSPKNPSQTTNNTNTEINTKEKALMKNKPNQNRTDTTLMTSPSSQVIYRSRIISARKGPVRKY